MTRISPLHMEKNVQKAPIGSELGHVKQKKDVVAVHMIGRQIPLWRHRSFTSAEMTTLTLKLWYSSKHGSL